MIVAVESGVYMYAVLPENNTFSKFKLRQFILGLNASLSTTVLRKVMSTGMSPAQSYPGQMCGMDGAIWGTLYLLIWGTLYLLDIPDMLTG